MGISDIVWSMIMASPVQCSSKMLCTLPAHEGDSGPGLERHRHLSHADEPALRRETHRVLRESRPGAGRRQDHHLLAHRQGYVHAHVDRFRPLADHRSRHRAAQDDTADHARARRRGVPQLHGYVVCSAVYVYPRPRRGVRG